MHTSFKLPFVLLFYTHIDEPKMKHDLREFYNVYAEVIEIRLSNVVVTIKHPLTKTTYTLIEFCKLKIPRKNS